MKKSKFPLMFLILAIIIFVIILFSYYSTEKAELLISNYEVWTQGESCYGALFTIQSNINEILNLSSLKLYLNGNEVEKFNLNIENLGFCNPQQIVKGEKIEIFIENAGCSESDVITVNISNYSVESRYELDFALALIPYGCAECESGICNFERCDLENKCLEMRAVQEKDPSLCEQMKDEQCYISTDVGHKRICNKIEYCYWRIALEYKNLEYCNLMNRTGMKVDCYTDIAVNLKDIKICDIINESWSKLIDVELEIAACKADVQRPVVE
jgi:hypothetical protein